jgi:Fe-S oxidoreductase/predicted DNA-binding transcriptional regulator YafY
MEKLAMSRSISRASRLQRIEELLLSTPDGYTVQELAGKLGIHRTTVWRDLNEISSTAPVQQIGNRYLIDHMDYLSSVKLSSGESLMLYLAIRRMIRRLPYLPPMMTLALEKLVLALRRPSAGQLAESIQMTQNERPSDSKQAQIWETLVQAWLEQLTVRFTYQERHGAETEEYEVQPYLFEPEVVGEGVCLIGYSSTHRVLRAFKVERIVQAVLTTQRFKRPDTVDVDSILREVWGIWYGKEMTEVRLRFYDPVVAQQVREILWLPSQKTYNFPDGGVEWSAQVIDVLALVPWIRSWGPACEVLAPHELREHITEVEYSIGGIGMATSELITRPSFSETFLESLQAFTDGEFIQICLQCGACSGICPVGYLMDFPPRRMIAALRADMFDTVMDTDTVWMCVSCYACAEVCPAKIPLTAALMTRAKEEMLLAGNIPTELQDALENSQRYGNPLGESPRRRTDWTKDITPEVTVMSKAKRPVDVLWFVGDYASYHPRVQQTTKALAKVLNTLGVDFGILGPEESSDGDSQRLAGERGLFEILAEKNGKAFSKYQFDEIITTDPHAYNAIKNEYPALGICYPVRHYTQFLVERLDQLKPLLKQELKTRITYHDPCYLGRVNEIFEEPRQLLNAIPGVELLEMAHCRETSLCCGGGGGGMWLDGFQWEKARVRLSEWRVREAIAAGPVTNVLSPAPSRPKRNGRKKPVEEAGAQILAVACPYEMPRFEDAVKTVEEASELVVKDIVELLAEAMGL